jgi:hypothetical protein
MPHQCTNCGHTFADGSKEMLSGCPGCGGNTFQFHPKGTDVPDQPPDDAEASPPAPEGGSAANTVGRAATKVRDFVGSTGGAGVDPEGTAPPDSGAAPSAEASSSPSTASDQPSPPNPSAPWPDDLIDEDAEDAEIIDADARRGDGPDGEDLAQASARGDVTAPEELAGSNDPEEGSANPPASGGTPPPSADEGPASSTASSDRTAREGSASTGDAPTPTDGRVVSEPSGENPGLEELREQLNDQFESIKILEPGQYELNLMELFDREEYIIALQENGRYVIQVPENWMGDRPRD